MQTDDVSKTTHDRYTVSLSTKKFLLFYSKNPVPDIWLSVVLPVYQIGQILLLLLDIGV